MIVEDYLRPAAIKATIITLDDQGRTLDLHGNKIRRFGFHVFRHSLCSFLMSDGENPAVIQATLRHTRLDMTMHIQGRSRSWRRKAGCSKLFSEVNGGCNGRRRLFSNRIVDGELVYNEALTARVGA